MKTRYIKKYKARVDKQMLYFGESAKTLESWTGGTHYKHLWAFEILGFKVEFWRKRST